MALVKRVARLFQSDMHAVLDRIEDPEALMKHSLREMEEDLYRDVLQAKVLVREHQQITDQIARTEKQLTQFDEELDICFNSGKDDLARSLIRRKLETEQVSAKLSTQQASLMKNQAELNSRIEENSALLETMKQKVDLIMSNNQAEPSGLRHIPDIDVLPVIGDDDVEIAFLREQTRRAQQ
jgi:phage shock protein A